MAETIPYTYLIGWSDLDVWYYGCRFAKGCNPSDLWNSYFTSSKYVKEFVDCFGPPDVKEIRKIFINTKSARIWENKVLKRMKVVDKDNWINKTDNISIDPKLAGHGKGKYWLGKNNSNHCRFGTKMSEENRELLKYKRSEQTKLKMKISRKKLFENGFISPNPSLREDVKIKMSKTRREKDLAKGENNGMYGKQHSEETKLKMSLAAKNRKKK